MHRAFGGLADPTYLIDAGGRVAFYQLWTHAPTLHRKLEALRAQRWIGVVDDGIDRVPHMLPALTLGWTALRKGLPQSVIDLELAAPGSALATWVGYRMRHLLAPITLRDTPLPTPTRIALAAAAAGLGLAALALARRRLR